MEEVGHTFIAFTSTVKTNKAPYLSGLMYKGGFGLALTAEQKWRATYFFYKDKRIKKSITTLNNEV